MLELLKKEANYTVTENNAKTNLSSISDCLDLFATIGALRSAKDTDITDRFFKAWAENRELALKTLFFARDVRGGLGERRVFRTILKQLAAINPDTVLKNLWAVSEFGRFDDLLVLLDTPLKSEIVAHIRTQLDTDIAALNSGNNISLLAKWLPSVNTHNKETVRYGKLLAKELKLSEQEYRKTLSKLRKASGLIENNLRERDYSFDYSKQPSLAMLKYRKAFYRNDEARYSAFLESVNKCEAKINTGTLYPYDVIRPIFRNCGAVNMSPEEIAALDTTWNALEDFTQNTNSIVVADGSGSMYNGYNSNTVTPISVAMSLAVYFAERNKGSFSNHFITFSENPRLVEIKGANICEKVVYCQQQGEVANTNIQRVFELILNTAVKNKLKQADLPETVYIISDMEFDSCAEDADITNFERAKAKYESRGYTLPKLVFWNVQSRNLQQPVTMNEQGVALVSGASPRIFSMLTSPNFTPYTYMLETLSNQRYEKLAV